VRKGLFYTIVAAIGLVAGACERAMADDAAPSYPQSVAPVLGTSYSESAPQAAAAPCNACNSCNAGQNAGVFDSCHLGNACGGNACGGNACGCDNCCDNCCDCCCPCWCIRAGAMFLGRSTDPDHPLVTRAIAGPPPLGQPLPNTDRLDASQFAFPVTAGPDIDLIYNGCDYGFEVRYFSIGDFDTTVGPNPTVGATLQFATPIRAAANSVSASESSALSSVEINARKVVVPCVLTLLAGYRHIELTEQIFGTTVLAGTTTDVFSTQAFNRLDGFQIGGEAVLWRPSCRFRVEGIAKVGIFGDATSNFGSNAVGGGAAATATATGANTAFMSEWGITGVVQITCHLAARIGYEGLLLDGVGVASQQMSALNPLAGTGTTVNTGTPIYQGGFADLQYCW